MIQYPIDLPAEDCAAKCELVMYDVVTASVSPFTGVGQFFDYNAGRWGMRITIPPVGRSDGQKWISFLAKLRGRVGTFQAGVPGHRDPLGSARETQGVPRVKGGTQQGLEILVDGMPASTYEYLADGDFIQIGVRLYIVTARVNTNSSGEARINVWPWVEYAEHADGARVIVQNAKGLFRLRENIRSMDLPSFDTYGLILECEEAL